MSKPIFIIGCPRSGTTFMLNLLAAHEDVAWVSGIVDRWPARPGLSMLNRIYDVPVVGNHLYRRRVTGTADPRLAAARVFPRPSEPWRFWSRYLTNFRWPRDGNVAPRRTTAADLAPGEASRIQEAVQSICRFQGKTRFISKYTDFPRIAYLRAAFPDAVFLHVVRDGRAVSHSYRQAILGGAFDTWDEREWWIQGWPAAWRTEWRARYHDLLSFVAFQWKFFVTEIRKDAVHAGSGGYLEVRYRDLVASPSEELGRILAACGLSAGGRADGLVRQMRITDMNWKWQEELAEDEVRMLDEIVHEPELRTLLDDSSESAMTSRPTRRLRTDLPHAGST